ncbi:MAG TPA: phosphotransferase, partial [Nitrobacter sp.]|nr:phosphotransferase [Nitrobacter sp.]
VEGTPPAPIVERYRAATDLLAALHGRTLPDTLPLTAETAYAIPAFDPEAMLIEVGLMLDWYLIDRGIEPGETLRAEFMAIWRALLAKPDAASATWVLRDFHSPNLIWLEQRHDIGKVGIIDFQDTVLG